MEYLFITDNSWRESNPVYLICLRLARYFSAQGHSVTILGNCEDPAAPLDEAVDGVRHLRFYYPINRETRKILNRYRTGGSAVLLMADVLRHPMAGFVGLLRLIFGYNPIERVYAKRIGAYRQQYPVSAVVAFTAPYYTAMGLARAAINTAATIVYQMDPYATHREMGGPRATRQEAFALKSVDAVVVTPEIYAGQMAGGLAAYNDKLVIREFPVMEFDAGSSPVARTSIVETYPPGALSSPAPLPGFEPGKTHLLFAGNFYPDLRPPGPLLHIIEQVGDPGLRFVLMGRIDDSLTDEGTALAQRLQAEGKLALVPPQLPEVARAAMEAAQVLLNLGNSDPTMLPSKLYDCIATGKPIVNLCRVHSCPSLPRLEHYPLALSLFEGDDPKALARRIEVFCAETAGKLIPRARLEELYAGCTLACAYETILEIQERAHHD